MSKSGAIKRIVNVVESVWQAEGKGARVRRSIGRPELRNLDPFLMLDEFFGNANDGAGFPDHPHRGFETVAYLLEGMFLHEDFTGRKGTLRSGDIQWMTAGRGIVHSEMPGPVDTRGLQLWVNLKSDLKMCEPTYQEIEAKDIPSKSENGITVKVIAGESMGVSSPVVCRTPTYYLHFKLEPGAPALEQKIPKGWTTIAYNLEGSVNFGSESPIPAHHTVVFSNEEEIVSIENSSKENAAELLLIAGQPLGEPVARRGPFVMNTEEEIEQTLKDYKLNQNGFENATPWLEARGSKQNTY